MQIQQICNNSNVSKYQNFRGFWGKTTKTTDIDRGMNIPNIKETCYYFPYPEESDSKIKEVQKEINKAYIDTKDGIPKYVTTECKRCSALPFSEEKFIEYWSFNENNRLSKKIKNIHRVAKALYVDNTYDKQHSAINPLVDKRIEYNA